MRLAPGGLIDREPHHVVRVHQRDGEEPRLRRARRAMSPQPRRGGVGDQRIEVHTRAGPTHEVAGVAPPVAVPPRPPPWVGAGPEVPPPPVARSPTPAAPYGNDGGEGRVARPRGFGDAG